MVSALTWVVVGVVAYTAAMMALRSRERLPESVRVAGPIITLHTKRGRAFLDWLATPTRFWKAWGNLGVGFALVVMVAVFFGVIRSGMAALNQPEVTAVRSPQNVLVIPGVNDFLPLSATPEIVLGLLVGLVVHEGGHGLLCRVEDIDIDSMGLAFFSFIPIGAFVEPKVESRNDANRGSQVRMFAAGVTNNFAITVVAFVLLFGPITGSIAVVDGVPVGSTTPGSAAQNAGIDQGDVITSVNGEPVANASNLGQRLGETDGERIRIGRKNNETVTVNRSLLITRAIPGVLDGVETGPDEPTRIREVNGTEVHTEREFARAVSNRTVVHLQTNRGNATLPVGTYVVEVSEDGPLHDAGAPLDTAVIVTRIDGVRTPNTSALQDVLEERDPGTTVPVETYVDGDRRVYNVTLGEDPNGDGGFVGVFPELGYSGVVLNDFGVRPYPAEFFLALLGGGDGGLRGLFDGGFLQRVFAVLILPFIGAVSPGLSDGFNFAGFVPSVASFYTTSGPLAFLGGGLLALANALFWTGWVNLNLGLFNCVPSFPLDGGHIFRAGAESVVSRLPLENRRRVTTALAASISVVMIAALLLMVFGPQLLN
jgi:membrane-associated protease RseP (regulator of RpoE activity)